MATIPMTRPGAASSLRQVSLRHPLVACFILAAITLWHRRCHARTGDVTYAGTSVFGAQHHPWHR